MTQSTTAALACRVSRGCRMTGSVTPSVDAVHSADRLLVLNIIEIVTKTFSDNLACRYKISCPANCFLCHLSNILLGLRQHKNTQIANAS